jgi:hypothetical protein
VFWFAELVPAVVLNSWSVCKFVFFVSKILLIHPKKRGVF